MQTFRLGIAAATTGLVLLGPAAAAHAVVDPSKVAVLESVQKMDPVVMANCTTGTAADPAAAVVVPPEVPLVSCLSL
ncbi:hypothetical protein FXF51_37430 [Nonomuraea sp. PA05]|uniref:hypothetical protein n=1 Tax=Nonomuraea sp. PA05 TaxID=2604466 RepID=UPI0011D91443|nr:hypothetical protein [Nonomuraea sp. PA05]TYB58344.1 hypothetical protein FXF51_37430 [Nonomuraea sp. PA05]